MPKTKKAPEPEVEGTVTLLPVKFNTSEQTIAELRVKCSSLTIAGVNDKDGYKAVHTARIEVRDIRTALEKKRKEVIQEARSWIDEQNDKAKLFTAWLEEIEEPLQKEEDEYNRLREEARLEKLRLEEEARQERIRREYEQIQERVNQCLLVGCAYNGEAYIMGGLQVTNNDLRALTDEDFNEFLEDAKHIKAAQEKAKQEEEARRAAEQARIDAERKKLQEDMAAQLQAMEQQRLELKQQQEKLRQQEAELKAQKEAADRELQIQEARKAAAAQAIIDEQRRAQEAKDAADKAAADLLAKQKREEALRPDKEKLQAYAAAIIAVPQPALKDAAAKAILFDVNKSLKAASNYILNRLNTI